MIDHRSASFGRRADAYDEVRPSYPAAAIDLVVESLDLGASATVVDLAAGTGKLTRLLTGRFANLIAIEPSAGMRDSLEHSLPDVEVLNGAAESIPLADASAGAVFVAEAFHWFDPEAAVAEIGRVLPGGGGLAMLWNRERWSAEANPWLARFGKLIEPLLTQRDPLPSERGTWSTELEALGGFEPANRGSVDHVHHLDRGQFVELISTWSFVADLPDPERGDLLEQVRSLLGDQPTVDLDYTTELIWARRR